MKAEYQGNEGFYQGNEGFLQRDSVEHKGYAEARSTDCREGKNETVQVTCWKQYWAGIT